MNDVLERPLEDSYQARIVEDFRWSDWVDPARSKAGTFARADTHYKNFPRRTRPVEGPAPEK